MVSERGRARARRTTNRNPKFTASLNHMWELFLKYQQQYVNKQIISNFIFNPSYSYIVAIAVLMAELFINICIIEKVNYTEIDWKAYMQEVEGFINGTRDYSQLKGDTGPLVYPAGFVYIYSGLYYLTEQGTNIRLAQYIFGAVYLLTLALVFRLYCRSKKVPPYVLLLLSCCSYRIHSIYVLRLFNDPIAMIFVFGALNCFTDGLWSFGSLLYSLGVSVKMNVLLFAPALFLTYICSLGFFGTVWQLLICLAVQLLLGAPFLINNAIPYLKGSFDFERVFLYEWTVNWKFLPEETFVSKEFHIGLLAVHLVLLAAFAFTVWYRCLRNFGRLRRTGLAVSCQLLLLPMFSCNLIGVAVSRSLHYQFYVWYYHSLPYLLWCTPLPTVYRLLVLGVLELCWNIFPATWWSSALLHVCHFVTLVGIFLRRPTDESAKKLLGKLEKKSISNNSSQQGHKNKTS